MKKIIFFLIPLLIVISLPSVMHAQDPVTLPTIAGDSLSTADSVIKRISITGSYATVGLQTSIKKGTGTLDGKMYVYTSINGSAFVLTDSASFTALPALSTSFTGSVGGMTHTAIINKTAPPGSAFVVAVTQVGSLTASPVKFSYRAIRNY